MEMCLVKVEEENISYSPSAIPNTLQERQKTQEERWPDMTKRTNRAEEQFKKDQLLPVENITHVENIKNTCGDHANNGIMGVASYLFSYKYW